MRQVVDRLPDVLWRAGNLWLLPFGSVHFCVDSTEDDLSVRTVEWNGRAVLRGDRSEWLPGQNEHDGEGRVIQISAGELAGAVAVVGILGWWLVGRRRH